MTTKLDSTLGANSLNPIKPEPIETKPIEPEPIEPEPVETKPVKPEPVEPEADQGEADQGEADQGEADQGEADQGEPTTITSQQPSPKTKPKPTMVETVFGAVEPTSDCATDSQEDTVHVNVADIRTSSTVDASTEPSTLVESGPSDSDCKRFSRLFNDKEGAVTECANDDFYADLKLTPIPINSSVYQVLSSRTGLEPGELSWIYSLIHHGNFTHSWSLLPIYDETVSSVNPIIRPVALLETLGSNIGTAEVRMTDLQFIWDAKSIKMVHYHDSWSTGGNHVGFQVDEYYRYEWKQALTEDESGGKPIYLWKTKVMDCSTQRVAKISREPTLENPVGSSRLWCVEIDSDRVPIHLALLSAFAIKVGHSRVHSLFASKETDVIPPTPLVNFAFQDEGRVYGRSDKYWGDWEESRVRRSTEPGLTYEETNRVTLIRVFNHAYVQQFAITPQVLSLINKKQARKIDQIKSYYNI